METHESLRARFFFDHLTRFNKMFAERGRGIATISNYISTAVYRQPFFLPQTMEEQSLLG